MKASLLAEGLGTGLLLYVVVGSGIAVERLGADPASGLFVHAAVVGAALAVLIAMFISVSGSHFNPAVTLAMWRSGRATGRLAGGYVVVQLAGAVIGVVAAHLSFEVDPVSLAAVERSGAGRVLAELIATLVLVAVILILVDTGRTTSIPAAVGAWVATIVVATSSTGFANPAVTVARIFSDSYTGIAPRWVPGFVLAQVAGAGLAVVLARRLTQEET